MQDFLHSLQEKMHDVESEENNMNSNDTDEVLGLNPEIYSIDSLLDVLKNP